MPPVIQNPGQARLWRPSDGPITCLDHSPIQADVPDRAVSQKTFQIPYDRQPKILFLGPKETDWGGAVRGSGAEPWLLLGPWVWKWIYADICS